jgi:putative ABC transport system permease protein
MLRDLFDDLRFGTRLIRKHPGLSAATVLTFTLGLGLDAGVFTVIDGLMFRPRVAHDPSSFVELTEEVTDTNGHGGATPLISLRDYHAFAGAASLHDVAAWTPVHAAVGSALNRTAEQVPLLVTCNFFTAYGPDRPLLGRTFRSDDCDHADAPPIAIIGEDLWRTTLNADPNVVGTSLLLNNRPFTIVGVMASGYSGQLRAPIWIPLPTAPLFYGGRDLPRETDKAWLLGVVGRLRPGASRESAAAELAVIARQLDVSTPNRRTTIHVTNGATINEPVVQSAASWIVPLIMVAPSLVLLIACANVAVLLLSRSAARQQEIAIRISLGASRARLMRMLIAESALLAAIAAPPSLAVAYAAPKVFRTLIPQLPYYPFAIDTSVIAYVAGVALVAAMAASIAPALESLKKDVNAALHHHDALPGAIGWHARDVLMAAQVGLCLVLLFAAGVFLHAEFRLLAASPGYELDRVMLVVPHVGVPPHTPASVQSFYRAFNERVLGIPGVRTVAYTRALSDESFTQTETIVAVTTGVTATPVFSTVSSAYFHTLQIPVLAGTVFGDDVVAATPVIVSESLARLLWPGHAPLGERARIDDTEVTVVAVVRDVQSASSGVGERTVYRSAGPIRGGDAFYVGFEGGETQTAQSIRDAITTLDIDAAALPQTLGNIRRDQASKFMPIVELVLGLGGVALALGVTGVYGVVAFTVGRRMREMGIRIALGARRADIIRLVLSSGAAAISIGLGAGVGFALVGARTLERIFRNTPVRIDVWDPIVYPAVVVILAITTVVAMLGPARRAAAADPIHALRCD